MTILGIRVDMLPEQPGAKCEATLSIEARTLSPAYRREALRSVLEAVSGQAYAWNLRMLDLLTAAEIADLRKAVAEERRS